MTMSEQLAAFVARANYDELSEVARVQLKVRILDSLGCAIGALGGEPIARIREQLADFGGSSLCTLIAGGRTAPDRAAFYNSALVRYLDFNDSYLAKGETCHPSDNLGAVLAGGEYQARDGKNLMVALAVAYQVFCRLCDVAPVRARGFDHTTLGSFAVAAGVAKALDLNVEQTTNAIGICGTAFNALRVTRTGALSNWKGLAYPNTVFGCTHATFLAMRGITGPREVFEGNKGFADTISGPFAIDWSKENLEKVTETSVKKYNAEVHSQSTLEAVLELRQVNNFKAEEVDRVEVETFDVAYNIIGGGEEGEKTTIRTKEEADHSLPYMVAVAILDGEVTPSQYLPQRILRQDVQNLLRKVSVRPSNELSQHFPRQMPTRVTVWLRDGKRLFLEKLAYEGYYTQPIRWETEVKKFDLLSAPGADAGLREQIVQAVANLETITVADLMQLLARVRSAVAPVRRSAS